MANTIGDRLSWFLNGDDTLKSDDELAREAQYLADQRWKMGQLALQEGDAFKSDEYLRGEAMALGEAMVGKVGGEDAYGIMWSPDQRGYKTGREFKDAMVKLWKEPESFVSKDWEEFSKLDRKGRLAKAMEDVSATKVAMHHVGNFLDDHVVVGGAFGAVPSVESLHTDEEKAARQTAWEDRIIRDYEAKLRKKNAWMDLMAISSRMEGGAKACLDALLQSGDNALPERLYTTFNSLSDNDKEIVCHARELMKPTWDGTDAGTIAHDAAVGLLNIAAKLAKSPVEQATKLTAIGANRWFDAGIDVNAIARRRQYLWNVTGGLSEKDSPFMEFEQRCEDHGIVGDALIGAVSTLPYMAAAAVPYAGPALVAAEAMQEMDERIVAEGGDITNPRYLVTSAVLGGIYSYIERLQVGKLIGEVGDLEIRGAMVKGLWQAWKDKPWLMAWNLTEKTLSESVQEGLQNGVMGVNKALGLGKSVPAAFGEGFVEDFVGSLGTMFVIGAGGHVVGHAVQSGWKGGAVGQKMRADNYLDAVRDGVRTAGVFERGEASATKRMAEITEAIDRLYGAWKENGRGALDRLGLSEATVAQIEDYYRESESLADGMTPSADEKFRIATTIAEDISEKIKAENAALRADPGRVGRAGKWLGRGNGLADMRRTWARGNALTQYKVDENGNVVTDENGKPVIEADLGAKELEKDGYTPEVAKAISELLRQEHREFYSKGAVDAMRHAYEKATDRQTAAAERLAAGLKGGEVVRRDGLTFVRFDIETGKDADGKPIVGKGEYLIEEHPEFADFKPDFANPKANEAASIAERFGGKMTAERWMSEKMTPAEREAFWNENASGAEGRFTLVNPATGSQISAGGVKLLGRIDIDPRADGTAIYHENLHGFVRFCRESGVLNEEDVAAFVAAFGERRPGVDELFNEETAADAARSFVVKRRAGSVIEDTPANRALAKLFSFGMRIASEGDIRWAEQKAAERAMKAVTDQMEVSAANAKADESGKNGGKVVQPETAENKGENGSGGPVYVEGMKIAELSPMVRRALSGRNSADNSATADSIAKPAAEVKRVGFTALTPTGNRKVGGHYEVVPLAELMDSNQPGYPMELQARDRKDNAAEEQTREDHITNFEPGYLLADPGTDGGAPLVVRQEIDGKVRLVVVSGNGRTMILQALAARKLYDRYRGAMKGWAEANGIGVGVGDEANPVLIRVIDDLGGATLKEIADLSNTNAIQQMNEEERARTDAEVIRTFGIAKLYAANADGSPDMTPGANDEFFAAFQRGIGMNDSLYNPDGSLTQAARDRAVRALLAITVGQGERGRDTVKKLVAQADTLGLNRQKNAAAAMAAAVADLERKPEYAIGADISRAYADYMDFLERKKAGKAATLGEYVAQQDMLEPRSEIAEGVLLLLGGSANARQIAETVKTYCAAAEGEDPSGNLFGAARTREQIWSDAVKVAGGDRYSFGNKALSAMEEIASGKSSGKIENAKHGTISYPLGTFGTITESGNIRHGLGLLHIVYARMAKEGSNLQDAIDVAIGVAESAAEGEEARNTGNRLWLDKNGIRAVIAKNADGQKVITGYEIDADRSGITSRAKPDLPHLPTPRSEDVISALKNRIAQIRGNSNRLADAVKELAGNIGPERMKRLEARYSFAAANPVTLTGEDVKLAISKWGTTDDINKGIYCLPDGTMLQGKGQAYVIGGRRIEAFGHDGWIDLILKNSPKVDTSTLDGVAEVGGQIEAAQRGIAALGAIRIVGDKNGFMVSKEPTAAQYDALYDMAEKSYQVMESNGDDEMLIDVTDENLETLFTLSYARGTSPRRIIDDLRGWYERGERRDQGLGIGDQGVVAMFHSRWSIAPKGAQKGAAVAYPDAGAELRAMDDARFSIGQLYTGSAADYEKPSLLKVGTGEGAQVYGWGLYASNVKDVADVYAGRRNQRFDLLYKGENITTKGVIFPRVSTPKELALKYAQTSSSVDGLIRTLKDEGKKDKTYAKKFNDAIAWVKNNKNDFSEADRGNYLYEQTFFTNRAPGDESHLLKWYEKPTQIQKKLINDQLVKEGYSSDYWPLPDYLKYPGMKPVDALIAYAKMSSHNGKGNYDNQDIYDALPPRGNPKGKSEFLARADIDGIKYPVDSYGGKTVKDGDKAGWNYVSFRDDNIRVDHKWVDGQQRWSVSVSPTLREDVAAALNTDRAKGEIVKGEKRVVFCDTPGLLVFVGVPNAKIYSKAYALRKIANDHKVTAEQIAGAPELMNHPAAIFDDNGEGYVILTDANVPDANGVLAPMMIYLRPDGEGNYLASAYSRTEDAEAKYVNLANAGKILYLDKNKVANLTLRGEALSSLSTFSIGDDVVTPERITAEIIAKSAADGNGPRWSIGARRRAEFRELIGRKRPDIAAEDVAAYLDEIAGYDNAKKQKLAVHWIITGAIELPEDAYKLDKAISTAERAKVDPFQYRNPEDIFAAFPQHLPKEKPIDPDTVPELTAKEDRGHGITVYAVSEKIVKGKRRAGQVAMRKVINTHWGKDASPWCLLRGDGNGELTEESRGYWEHYSALPKKVAFLNGRLLAFMATDQKDSPVADEDGEFEPGLVEGYRDYIYRLEQSGNMELMANAMSVAEWGRKNGFAVPVKTYEKWWDRNDASHDGIPIEGKIAGDPLGRSGLQELKDGKLELVGRTWKGDRKNGKYEEWEGEQKKLDAEFKDGRPVGWRRTYRNGEVSTVEHYNAKSEHDRPQLEFYPGLGLARYVEYEEGDRVFRSVRFNQDGKITDYHESRGEGGLPKIAVTFDFSTSLSWEDDTGDHYSVLAYDGKVQSAEKIEKGTFNRNDLDVDGDAALRAKLEGESAAVLEAVKAEAAAIYREYGVKEGAAQDGTRWSIGGFQGAVRSEIGTPEQAEGMERAGADKTAVWQKTGWWRGHDGKWRIELPDYSAGREIATYGSFEKRGRFKLDDIRKDKSYRRESPGLMRLTDAYPDLRDLEVRFVENPPDGVEAKAAYLPDEKAIEVYRVKDPRMSDAGLSLVHELQHAIQWSEGFSYGNLSATTVGEKTGKAAKKRYFANQGEIEAYLAQARSRMDDSQRASEPPWETEKRLLEAISRSVGIDVKPEDVRWSVATAWRPDFPDATSQTTRKFINDHYAELFRRAKAGSVEAASDLIEKVCKVDKIRQLGKDHPNARLVAPVVAYEKSGHNQIPRMFARYIAEILGVDTAENIVQTVRAGHTGADASHRLFTNPEFDGEVEKGAEYIIVDDHITQGGTINALRDHIERNGGKVVAVTSLTLSQGSSKLSPRKETLDELYAKWPDIDNLLRIGNIAESAGALTESQAKYILKFSPDTFRDRAVAQGNEGSGRVRQEALGASPSEEVSRSEWSAAADNPLAAIANARTSREVEAAARLSFSARLADGDEGAAERALVNYVAYHKLTGGAIPRAATLAKLGLTLGMKSVQAKRIIEDAQRVADHAAGTVIEKAARNGDVGTAFSLMEREKEREEELRKIISGGAKAGGDLVLGGVVAQGTLLGKRIEQTMRTMTAADLADMEGDTGIDLAAEILENDPKAFDEELKAVKPKRGEEAEGEAEAEGEDEGEDEGGAVGDDGLTDREKWKRDQAKKEAAKRVQEFIERAKQKAEENKAKAAQRREENRQRVIAGEKPVEPGMGDTVGGEKFGAPEKSVAGFKNKWEFAAFVREWAWDKYQKTHGTTSLGKSEENRLFAEFYRKCAKKILQDLADKLLDPKGARAWANRRIGELEKGFRPNTIERASADIFAFINRNAIREERRRLSEVRGKLIEKFRKEIRQFITGKEFEELKEDSTRRLTGWVEEAARYMMKVCQLSAWATNGHASAFEKERNELLSKIEERREVYDGSGRDEAYMEANDAEIVRARWKLALLEQYGGMAQMMPGEIESLKTDAIRYLTEEAVALEERWKDTKEKQDRLRRAIAGGIVGPNGQRYESKAGWFGHLFDDLNGLLRLRLKHLMRFAGKKERAEGEAAINEIVNMLGRGEVEYARAVQRDRRELFAALGRIFQDKEGRPNRRAIREYLKRMEEDIPVELSRQLSNQGFAEHMTYGQMLQLLVSVEQKSYAENVRVCGRGGQAELIRNSAAFTQADALFIDWLRAFYEAKRGEISEVTLRMVGNRVDSPDPLYCPVKIYRGELAKDLHIDAGRWNAIDDVLSRRVMHLRDFDESASVLGQFYDRSNRMAGLIAWAESGTVIQNVICSGAVQQQINLAFGSGESAKIRRQLEDTFNGGTSRSKTPGEIVFMDKAMNFITFGYLGFNPLSAAKQTTSFTVWANVLPGGFRELWHHMTHIDREAVRHIMESDEYKVRYGDDTGSGQDFATKSLNENAGQNPFMRLMTGPGMWLLKKGDFLPGIWIMQGVYKSLFNKHLNEGMEEAAADRLAITEAFNLLEETQQSGRTYNTSALAREHGRLGSALVQFATSPLQQLQYETQAFREWRDLKRYGADPERIAEARAKLVRAAFINHVLLPAAMELVISVFRAIMGDEPKWEKDGYAWDLLRDILLGQASRIFYVGVLASSMIDALFKRQMPRGSQLIPSEGAITVLANVAITAHDVVTLDGDKVQKDLERMAKSLAPTRIPYNLYRRVTGDADVDRKKAKAK